MFKLIFIYCSLVLLTACSKNGCDNLPDQFSSYEEAERKIEATEFNVRQEIRTPESSWIYGATFYSCDGELGYLEVETDHGSYYLKDVPKHVWEAFQATEATGKFFNEVLRGNYLLELRD
jgi:hypothetical protein